MTEIEEALLAKVKADRLSDPLISAAHKAPQNVSPAAVVSTALTLKAGIKVGLPSIEAMAPFDPIVIITSFTSLLNDANGLHCSARVCNLAARDSRSLCLIWNQQIYVL